MPGEFPHQRLRVWHRALAQLAVARDLKSGLPRGVGSFGDQLLRASGSVVLNIAEGANARTAGEKRNGFGIARKENAEAAAVVEALCVMGLIPVDSAADFVAEANEIAAILTVLARRAKTLH